MADTKTTIKAAATELFKTTTHDVLWANPAGEFFTSENLGRLSLKKNQVLTKYTRPARGKEATEDASEPAV